MFFQLKKMKKFTTKEEIDKIFGQPKCQIEDRQLYYYGNGLFIAYSVKCFKVENCERIEYGEDGVYAVCIYHFADVKMIKEYFELDDFKADDIEEFTHIIDDEVTYGKTFYEIHNLGLEKINMDYYREGENWAFINGKMEIQNLFIIYGSYTLLFRGHSKENKISGFQYTLCE